MTIEAHATNDDPCDICERPVGASRETLNRHVICEACSSYVASAKADGGARHGAAAAPPKPAGAAAPAAPPKKLTGESFIAAIADAMEDAAKRDPDAHASVFNVNLGLSYTP